MYEYENLTRKVYGSAETEMLVFIPVCTKCGRFVKADQFVMSKYCGRIKEPNATCKKCGRVAMPFEGFL